MFPHHQWWSHQTITVWDAWNQDAIQQLMIMQQQAAMVQQEMWEEEDENYSR